MPLSLVTLTKTMTLNLFKHVDKADKCHKLNYVSRITLKKTTSQNTLVV